MSFAASLQRTASVARKEVIHLLRDRQTLLMTLFFPVVELVMLGYAIDTNVRRIPTAVLDQAQTQESRALVERFKQSDDFLIVANVRTEKELTDLIVRGQARVGVKVPENYSRRRGAGAVVRGLARIDALRPRAGAVDDDVADRRGAGGDPPRRLLARAVAARGGAVGHGAADHRLHGDDLPQARRVIAAFFVWPLGVRRT
jgi:hypothetical protein